MISFSTPFCKGYISIYISTHIGVFNDRQLAEINGILNRALRQATCLLSNFFTDIVQRLPKDMGLGLPSVRDRATEMEIEHLINTMHKDTKRGFLAPSHTLRIILTQFNHWPTKALETNPTKLPTLHILRLASTIKDLKLDNLLTLFHSNDIAASLRVASQTVDEALTKKRQTRQGTIGTKDHDTLVRQ